MLVPEDLVAVWHEPEQGTVNSIARDWTSSCERGEIAGFGQLPASLCCIVQQDIRPVLRPRNERQGCPSGIYQSTVAKEGQCCGIGTQLRIWVGDLLRKGSRETVKQEDVIANPVTTTNLARELGPSDNAII